MSERKTALINIARGLLDVSLATLAAIAGATGNAPVAGLATFMQATLASGLLKLLPEKKQEEQLELPIPRWWTMEPRYQSWQAVCSTLENRLSAILKGVEENLREETHHPSSENVKRFFIHQVAQHLSPWEVSQLDRQMVAVYVTPLLVEGTSNLLKEAIDKTPQDGLAQWMAQITSKLDMIQQSMATTPAAPPAGLAAADVQAMVSPPDASIIATRLTSKMQKVAFDVYICYDEEDEAQVMKIGEQLKTCGILPWLDAVNVEPGVPRKLQQEEQIKKVSAAAMFIGQHMIKRGQLLQIYAFIEQYIGRECVVIPVLLPDAPKKPELPPFLAEFGWVDFRKQVPDPMKQLIWGITDERP